MILSGKEIARHMGEDIFIEPYDPRRLNPNSYNLTLHNELLVYENRLLDMKMENPVEQLTIPEEGLVLQPDRLYLGRTQEFTRTENFVPMLEGRSSSVKEIIRAGPKKGAQNQPRPPRSFQGTSEKEEKFKQNQVQ